MTKKEQNKQRIIEASLKEFAEKGYELASTNTIYKNANVSKGVIFLYFKSKVDLYYEVFRYYLYKINESISKLDLSNINDVFEKIVEVNIWKMGYYAKYPLEANFLLEAISKPPEEIKMRIYSHLEEISKLSYDHFFEDIDYSQFSSEYTKEEVIKFIRIAISGVQNAYMKTKIDIEYFQSIKDESMKFIKTVLKGMKK